jgi:uncharacterized membrane protein YfcA
MLLGLVAIGLVGISLGLLGAGGTAIALPILVYTIGLEPHAAVVVSLLLVGGVSAFGALLHAWHGVVEWRKAAAFAPFGVAGAVAGARLSPLLSGRVLLISFACLLLVIAARILLSGDEAEGPRRVPRWTAVALAGSGIGFLTGMLGVGGGFVVVPALIYFAGCDMRGAIGTSLVVIAVNSGAAFALHAARIAPDWPLLGALTASAAVGMGGGVWLSHRTSPQRLRRGFALLLAVLAVYMLARNVG